MNIYKVLKEIENNPFHTQRSLAETLDVSLGKINFLVNGLVEKGIISVKKAKNHPDKVRLQYILTPEGIKEKVKIASEYLAQRTHEFEMLQKEINELRKEVEGRMQIVSE